MPRSARARGAPVSYKDQLSSDEDSKNSDAADEDSDEVQVAKGTKPKSTGKKTRKASASRRRGAGDSDDDFGEGDDDFYSARGKSDSDDDDDSSSFGGTPRRRNTIVLDADESDNDVLSDIVMKKPSAKKKPTTPKASAKKGVTKTKTVGTGTPQKRKLKAGSESASSAKAKKQKTLLTGGSQVKATSSQTKKTTAKRGGGSGGVKTFQTREDVEAANVQDAAVKEAAKLSMMSQERDILSPTQGLSLPRAVAACDNREFKVSQSMNRKHHRLFVLPGQMSLQSIGTCGTIEGFASTKPVLNIEFAEEGKTLRLLGALIHPDTNYLHVNFDEREKQGVTLDAKYEEVVVFTSYEWVTRDGNGTMEVLRQGPAEEINWADPLMLGESYKARALASVPLTETEDLASQGDVSMVGSSQDTSQTSKRSSSNAAKWMSDESESDEPEFQEGSVTITTPRRAVSRRSAAQSARKAFQVSDDDDNDDDDEDDDQEEDDEMNDDGNSNKAASKPKRRRSAAKKVIDLDLDEDEDDNEDGRRADDDDDDDYVVE
ncbi:DNA-binding protein RHL1 [Hondaea fermentalgiana]|uniref:DNA-binding protein RHL1 n=1 Tax=Hondaea fermentalgiana TaxID=2315210 RepID=A0A2R5GVM2_9STRA|nr:DNA-binding protein RHL1 [Hondaea fermentalgiana]|eukprot:GBG34615.1 DNA-binding protein RHL1 [Hondaea fermentalgiana]